MSHEHQLWNVCCLVLVCHCLILRILRCRACRLLRRLPQVHKSVSVYVCVCVCVCVYVCVCHVYVHYLALTMSFHAVANA